MAIDLVETALSPPLPSKFHDNLGNAEGYLGCNCLDCRRHLKYFSDTAHNLPDGAAVICQLWDGSRGSCYDSRFWF